MGKNIGTLKKYLFLSKNRKKQVLPIFNVQIDTGISLFMSEKCELCNVGNNSGISSFSFPLLYCDLFQFMCAGLSRFTSYIIISLNGRLTKMKIAKRFLERKHELEIIMQTSEEMIRDDSLLPA